MKKSEADWADERRAMVRLLAGYYRIHDERILRAMEEIPRHLFIPERFRPFVDPYGNHPCPIGCGQTISQPYIVAYMTAKLNPQPGEKVLEIGSGSGYQAAVLAATGAEVYTIETIPELAEHARQVLAEHGFTKVQVRCGDGYAGWPPVPDLWAGRRPTALWQPDSDADADGIPAAWEVQYFGGTTNANPNAICANGINTVLQAYIAGINPNDPNAAFLTAILPGKVLQWDAVSGRVYSVYWTTNLLSGFQCLESNIPWTQVSFTNSTAAPRGYYKIGVRLAP